MKPHVELKHDKLTNEWCVVVDGKFFACYKEWRMAEFVRQQMLGGS